MLNGILQKRGKTGLRRLGLNFAPEIAFFCEMRNSLSYNRLCCLILRDGISRFAEKPVPCPQRAFFITPKSLFHDLKKPVSHHRKAFSAHRYGMFCNAEEPFRL